MGILSDLTLQDLRAATVLGIRTAITNKINGMTKKQLIILILKVADVDIENFEIEEKTVFVEGPEGEISRLMVSFDALGNKIKSHKIDRIYYPTGEIDTITLTELDALDVVKSVRKIKHYIDGKQPEIIA